MYISGFFCKLHISYQTAFVSHLQTSLVKEACTKALMIKSVLVYSYMACLHLCGKPCMHVVAYTK